MPNYYLNVTNMDLKFYELQCLLHCLIEETQFNLSSLVVEHDHHVGHFSADGGFLYQENYIMSEKDKIDWANVELLYKIIGEILKFKPLPF